MIPDIRNTFWRRVALVLTVASIIVIVGPVHLVIAVFKWIETEFEVDLKATWKDAK